MLPSLQQRVIWARQRPLVTSFVLGTLMAVVFWTAAWVVGMGVARSDFPLLLGLGLFVVGPLMVVSLRRRGAGEGEYVSEGFGSLPASLRSPASIAFCLAPLLTAGVMSPICLGYVYDRLRTRQLLVLLLVAWGLLLAMFGLVNHSAEGGAAEAVGVVAGLLNTLGGTVVCFRYRRALLAAG